MQLPCMRQVSERRCTVIQCSHIDFAKRARKIKLNNRFASASQAEPIEEAMPYSIKCKDVHKSFIKLSKKRTKTQQTGKRNPSLQPCTIKQSVQSARHQSGSDPISTHFFIHHHQTHKLLDNLADEVLAVDRVALLDTKRADLARVRSGDDHFLLRVLSAYVSRIDF